LDSEDAATVPQMQGADAKMQSPKMSKPSSSYSSAPSLPGIKSLPWNQPNHHLERSASFSDWMQNIATQRSSEIERQKRKTVEIGEQNRMSVIERRNNLDALKDKVRMRPLMLEQSYSKGSMNSSAEVSADLKGEKA